MALFFNKEIQKSKKTRIVFATTYSFYVSAQSLKNIFPLLSIEAKLIELGGEKNIETGLQNALAANDSVGGIVECVAQP